jgi:hypothetical protein
MHDIERVAQGLRTAEVLAREASGGALATAGAAIVLERLRAEAPVRTGRLGASLQARGPALQAGGTGSEVTFWGLGYGAMLARGTRPHPIEPRRGRFLVFRRYGRLVLARRVWHPGTKANPFPRRAAQRAMPALRGLLLERGEAVLAAVRG